MTIPPDALCASCPHTANQHWQNRAFFAVGASPCQPGQQRCKCPGFVPLIFGNYIQTLSGAIAA